MALTDPKTGAMITDSISCAMCRPLIINDA
jgi:hypothetical protein